MGYSTEQLERIFDRTDGKCHICAKQLTFSNYGQLEGRGKWEVEHSNAKANGGTDHLNNLYAACVSCNRSKGKGSTRSARATNRRTRAPYSAKKKAAIMKENTIGGGIAGLVLTALATVNPVALTIGAVVGSAIGNSIDPDK